MLHIPHSMCCCDRLGESNAVYVVYIISQWYWMGLARTLIWIYNGILRVFSNTKMRWTVGIWPMPMKLVDKQRLLRRLHYQSVTMNGVDSNVQIRWAVVVWPIPLKLVDRSDIAHANCLCVAICVSTISDDVVSTVIYFIKFKNDSFFNIMKLISF